MTQNEVHVAELDYMWSEECLFLSAKVQQNGHYQLMCDAVNLKDFPKHTSAHYDVHFCLLGVSTRL